MLQDLNNKDLLIEKLRIEIFKYEKYLIKKLKIKMK